ncbi:hypothetical protein ACA910_015322 [Epithemia clementina (nom. ined.)]
MRTSTTRPTALIPQQPSISQQLRCHPATSDSTPHLPMEMLPSTWTTSPATGCGPLDEHFHHQQMAQLTISKARLVMILGTSREQQFIVVKVPTLAQYLIASAAHAMVSHASYGSSEFVSSTTSNYLKQLDPP